MGVSGTSAFQNHKCTLEHPNSNFDMGSYEYDTVCDPGLAIVFFLLSLYWTNTIILVSLSHTFIFTIFESVTCLTGVE